MKKHRMQFVIFFALIVVFLLSVSSVGAAPKDGPVVQVSTPQSEFNATQDVLVNLTISNPTKHSVRILKWFTPGEGVQEPLFLVKVNGEPVPYTGATYKRLAPTGNDYLTLKSGEKVSYSINLGNFYDLSTSGTYEIAYNVTAYNLFNEKSEISASPDTLTSPSISFKADGRASKKPTPEPTPPPGGNSYKSCTITQQNTLVEARKQATIYASSSENYLLAINSGTARYLEWFGLFTSTRYNKVASHFTALSDAWDNAGVTFDCSCKQNYYAYVYPNNPYTIYLCKVFWTAPMTGTDSKAGTLIHEMSHFYVVASTQDYVYGQTAARNLAITNPDQAIMNADNHEYFAENNPALP